MLDERMLEVGSFITNQMRLCEVLKVIRVGNYPAKRREVNVEDCYTGTKDTLTEKQLKDFTFVSRSVHAAK